MDPSRPIIALFEPETIAVMIKIKAIDMCAHGYLRNAIQAKRSVSRIENVFML